jgi:hypothetical protein
LKHHLITEHGLSKKVAKPIALAARATEMRKYIVEDKDAGFILVLLDLKTTSLIVHSQPIPCIVEVK